MSEYIEREALTKGLKIWQNTLIETYGKNDEYVRCLDSVLLGIDNVPAADVRPVVRGTWVGIDDFPHDDWECDHCGCVVESTNDPWNYYHFCPNCGADMREESL